MGVRESAAQQPEGEMRLQEMTVESKAEKKPYFDAREMVSEEEWEEIMIELKAWLKYAVNKGDDENVNRRNERDVAILARNAALIFPERTKDIRLMSEPEYQKYWEKIPIETSIIYDKSFDDYTSGVSGITPEYTMSVQAIFPERIGKQGLLKEENWQSMLDQLSDKDSIFNLPEKCSSFLREASSAKILFPELAENLNLDDDTWGKIEKQLLFLKGKSLSEAEVKWQIFFGQDFFISAGRARILFPEKMKDFPISRKDWEMGEVMLEEMRHNDAFTWREFLELAASMQILAAKEVIIDENGLRLVMPEKTGDFKEKKLERPMRKSF